ncbi:MAG: 50S ribosomal protein L13 [Candidatus Omnitrophica bacterium]|nr:50S ribosomal protein L13 [Candidatus Omnitrophota bacterium]MBD3269434.1 50S ribosomal protein L13 [Candidatus Omnitrophota bacterium]
MKKTRFFNNEESRWFVIDAKDKILGKVAVRVAWILQGKTKATYTPNFLCGDRVVIINARHVKVTGKKIEEKIYNKYSGYPGGRKEISLGELLKKNPSKVLYLAVKGMLPKNKLGTKMLKSLRIYPDGQHDHQAQKPQVVEV